MEGQIGIVTLLGKMMVQLGLYHVCARVVAGHEGEVFVEVALFSIFTETVLSDCPRFVHNL